MRPSSATNVPLPSVGLGGVELRTATRRLAALELRRSLLEERARPFLVVLTLRGLARESADARAVRLVEALEVEIDGDLAAVDRQRRVVGDEAEIVVGHALEVAGGDEALDEADRERFARVDGARGIEDVLRV